ncbi:MAG: hypothetical protein HQ570_03810 [Candidatus Omnitrophica bacterium]|nr:hypothetical protein [Candidatus Omnitrophota bacterium]
MYKRFVISSLISLFMFFVLPMASAEDQPTQEESNEKDLVIIKGEIIEIAEDGNCIVVDTGVEKTKFLTTREFLNDEYLEVGDKVEVIGERTANGLRLVDYNYSYDE